MKYGSREPYVSWALKGGVGRQPSVRVLSVQSTSIQSERARNHLKLRGVESSTWMAIKHMIKLNIRLKFLDKRTERNRVGIELEHDGGTDLLSQSRGSVTPRRDVSETRRFSPFFPVFPFPYCFLVSKILRDMYMVRSTRSFGRAL